MKIGIIGAGQIGGALSRRLTAVGHEVSVANSRGPRTLADLAGETGARAVTAREAARAGDMVVIASSATDLDAAGVRQALAKAIGERKPEWRATAASPGTFANPA